MPNYIFLACFKPQIYSSGAKKLKLNIHLTKSTKRDHIYTLGLCMLEEHSCLILASLHDPKLKYSTHARK